MSDNSRDRRPPVFVVGGAWNALGIVRALGRVDVKTICLTFAGGLRFAGASRFARQIQIPDATLSARQAGDALLKLASRYDTRPVLLFTEDAAMFIAGERETEFRAAFRIPQSPWELMGRVLNKRTLYALAQQYDIPFPQTWDFADVSGLLDAIDTLPVPCVAKPEITVAFLENLPPALQKETHHRTRHFTSTADMRRWSEAMIDGGLNVPVLVQDYIPGGAESLYTLTSYSDRSGTMLVGSVGHKVHQFPPEAGCIVSGRLCHEPAVFEQGRRLLEAIGFHGLANTEFKYDSRDGSYRLMEINPRLGKWNSSALAAGLNLPAIAYFDALGEQYQGPDLSTAADGVLWIDLLGDAIDCLYRARARGYPTGHLGLRRWLQSIRGRRIEAVWQWSDPVPSLAYIASVIAQFVSSQRKSPQTRLRGMRQRT